MEYPFPEEFVNPKTKEDEEYGLQAALAIYHSNNRYGPRVHGGDSDFDALTELAQGRQSVENIRKLFGHYRDPWTLRQGDDGATSLAYLDLQVLNMAPKYINRAVAKMQRVNYDISLEAIDIVSLDEKTQAGNTIRAFYRLKEWVQSMGIPLQQAFPDLDVSTLPDYPDELLYDINTNPKIKREIAGELSVKLIHQINRFKQKMRQCDWDLVVYGTAHLHCFLDENKVPRVERINPKFWGGSYVEDDDFEDQEYAFFLDCISVNQFIKEAGHHYTQDQLKEIANQYSVRNSTYAANSRVDQTLTNTDNLNYIPVMRYYFLSEDNRNFVLTRNNFGNRILFEKGYNYQPDPEVLENRIKKKDKIVNNSYTSVYGGTWIIDSDIVYNYGRKQYPRTNLVNATLPIKTFKTNFREGRTVSFAAQMTEPLYMANVAWNKIKETLAKGWTGVREIDFTQLEGVAMGRGGNAWTPRDVYEYLLMTNTLIKRGGVNKHDQTTGSAIMDGQNGIQLSEYFTALTTALNLLEQMTGTSAIEQAVIPDRLAVKNAQMSQMAADYDMEYLYNGHEYLYERTSHQLLLLMQEAKKSGAAIRGFIPSLGKVNLGFHEVPEDLAYTEYGMAISKQPSPEEWREFYDDMKLALANEQITPADSAFIREIDNLKQARHILVVRQKIQERKNAEEAQRNNQMAMEANAQAAELKAQAEDRKLDKQFGYDKEIKMLDGRIKEHLQRQKAEQDAITSNQTNQMKRLISKQQSVDRIIEKAMVTNVEKKRVEVEDRKVLVMANKPEPQAKKPAK